MSDARLRVLLAERDAVNRRVISDVLTSLGHEVLATGDGAAALALFEAHGPFDVLLLHVRLPDTTGIEVAWRIRATHPEQSIILHSGRMAFDPDTREFARQMGIEILAKPFGPAGMRDALARAADRQRGASS